MSETLMTPEVARVRLAQYGDRTSTWSTATYDSGNAKALHQIALTLDAEAQHLRKERDAFRDQRNAVFQTNERLLAEVQESDQARLRAENETRTVRREADALKARIAELQGALPVPVGDQPPPLADRLADIGARLAAATAGPWTSGRSENGNPAICANGRALFVAGWGTDADAELAANAPEDLKALRAEVQRLTAELDRAREAALNEAASWFDQRAATEPDQGYRARVMRGAANDVRRLATKETAS
jgi:transposase-like protein